VQAGTFAALWVVQFVVLDRVIFRGAARTAARPSTEVPETPEAAREHELAA
jgi:hypothetical protein